jgi:tRNA 2-thiocytidine biosynthesis protein TtcA
MFHAPAGGSVRRAGRPKQSGRKAKSTGMREQAYNPNFGIKKVAFGHHATDVAETFLMNLVEHRKFGSFCPRVETDKGTMTIIRPLIYLDEKTMAKIHRCARLPLLDYDCPYAHDTLRRKYKERLKSLEHLFRPYDLVHAIIASLEKVDFSKIWLELLADNDKRINSVV